MTRLGGCCFLSRLSLFSFLQLTVAADVDRDGVGLFGREVYTGAVEPLITLLTVAAKTSNSCEVTS